VNGTLFEYNSGGPATTPIAGGTYAVDPTSGRVTLSGVGSNPPVIYLTTPTDGISAFLIGTDTPAAFGLAEVQPAAAYSANFVSGNFFFATEDPNDNSITNKVGAVAITAGSIAGTQDTNGLAGLAVNQSVLATLTIAADGTGDVGANTVAITNGTKLFVIDESSSTPAAITIFEQ
jgi:hypothetical protein